MTTIHALTFFTANTISLNKTQVVGDLAGRAVYFFQNLSRQNPYQVASVIVTANILFFYTIHRLANSVNARIAAHQADENVNTRSYYLGEFVINISQLTFNLLLSKVTGVSLNHYWLVGITACTIALRILLRPPIAQAKLALPKKEIDEVNFVDDKLKKEDPYTWPKEEIYEGDLADGQRTGKGKLICLNGEIYEGDFLDGQRTGRGKLIWPDEEIYEGDFINDQRTGQGKLTYPNGEVYEGNFVDGILTGKGKFNWPNGNVYEGDFVDGKRTGKGKFNWPNGNVYEGDFVDGRFTGKGKLTQPNRHSGIDSFIRQFHPSRLLLVGEQGITLEEFLTTPLIEFVK